MAAATRRLTKELLSNNADPNPALESLEPVSDDDLFTWRAVLKGVKGTPYEGLCRITEFPCIAELTRSCIGGRWKILIKIPVSYPLHPPGITFETKICHPNIHFDVSKYFPHLFSLTNLTEWRSLFRRAQEPVDASMDNLLSMHGGSGYAQRSRARQPAQH